MNVSDVNEAPTSIWPSGSIVSENQPISTLVGSLSSNDPDAASMVTFALVTGPGSDDNDKLPRWMEIPLRQTESSTTKRGESIRSVCELRTNTA